MRIVVTGVKGGVGKSTIAYSILEEAVEEKKTLFVDMDNILTISNLLGVTKITKMNNLVVVPFNKFTASRKEYDLERYQNDVNLEIVDVPLQSLSYYIKLFGGIRWNDIVILVANEVPYVLSGTIEYGKSLKSKYNVNNVILVVNMSKGEIKNLREFPVIRVPFNYALLYNGVASAPSFIKIWKDIENFIY